LSINDKFADYLEAGRRTEGLGDAPLREGDVAQSVFVDLLIEEGYTRPDAEAAFSRLEEEESPYYAMDARGWVEDNLTRARDYLDGRRDGGSRRPPTQGREILPSEPPPKWFRWYSEQVLSTFKPLQYEALRVFEDLFMFTKGERVRPAPPL